MTITQTKPAPTSQSAVAPPPWPSCTTIEVLADPCNKEELARVLKLPSCTELDRLIGWVMGWTLEDQPDQAGTWEEVQEGSKPSPRSGPPVYWYGKDSTSQWWMSSTGTKIKPGSGWYPSRDAKQVLTVMDEVRRRGASVLIDGWSLVPDEPGAFCGWSACVELAAPRSSVASRSGTSQEEGLDTGDFRAETLPLAVCRAVVMAAVMIVQSSPSFRSQS